MAADIVRTKQHAYELLDQLGPGQLAAVIKLLEAMIHDGDDELTDEDVRAIAASREYFKQNPEGGSLRRSRCGLRFHHRRGSRLQGRLRGCEKNPPSSKKLPTPLQFIASAIGSAHIRIEGTGSPMSIGVQFFW
jgi:hypothetical protein